MTRQYSRQITFTNLFSLSLFTDDISITLNNPPKKLTILSNKVVFNIFNSIMSLSPADVSLLNGLEDFTTLSTLRKVLANHDG